MLFNGKKVLLLGSGGLRIGQAGEFDYSGSQAIKALKEEGIKIVLVNPNIATVQTDPGMADEVYFQPLNIESVSKIIEKERPDGLLLGFGGQTALNLGLKLAESGLLEKYKVKVLGTSIQTIKKSEDRELFKEALHTLHIKTPVSISASTVEDALAAAEKISYPVMMRSGFSLGGLGSGKIESAQQLKKQVKEVLTVTSQVLIEEYLLGWKEFEYEIIRDSNGSALAICNMENFDPMGIHTGESIVVAPAQTLSNAEHQALRNIALQIAGHFQIVGECNVQFAVNPKDGDYRVIEMNARLSRSSALASKATGYPLAFIAAKLALGWQLHEIKNTVTQKTCAFFEPALDYIVVKIPRWDTHKLKAAERTIGTEMKSVGEVMAIGRTFPEALQKAVGMLNIGASCLSDYSQNIADPATEIAQATDRRLFAIYLFFLQGGEVEQVHQLSKIDQWFLHHVYSIAQLEKKLKDTKLTVELLLDAKKSGFSDRAIGIIKNITESSVRHLRIQKKITPYIKQIDTLAGEFTAETNYLYLTYHACAHDIKPSSKRAVIILGSGPYTIGSSVEFDWCAVNASRTLRNLGINSIIINSNPETVSTDYDESDRLYFDQLSFERVQDIADFENIQGIIISVGGQVANNLALPLAQAGYPLLGTDPQFIDMAENRQKFSDLLNQLMIDQPAWEKVTNLDNAHSFARKVDYPVLIRPSYILSGSAMNVVYDDDGLEKYLKEASLISPEHPVVISKFIEDAKELEIDGVAKQGEVIIEAISEHIENAGIHSGDATVVLPPQKLYLETIRRTKKITRRIVKALAITGPFNIQFIAKNNEIKVIECNLRASRSFPFVSKVTNHNFIKIATEVMLGKYKNSAFETLELDYVGVKVPQFSYQRLKGANPVAHVEMASTGEVACLGGNLKEAFFNAWLATDQQIQNKHLLVSIADDQKLKLLPLLKQLDERDWEIYSTAGTHDFLTKNGIASYFVYKVSEKREPNIASIIAERKVNLIINIPSSQNVAQKTDGYQMRRMAIDHHIPLVTNVQIAQIILECLAEEKMIAHYPKSWHEFVQSKGFNHYDKLPLRERSHLNKRSVKRNYSTHIKKRKKTKKTTS